VCLRSSGVLACYPACTRAPKSSSKPCRAVDKGRCLVKFQSGMEWRRATQHYFPVCHMRVWNIVLGVLQQVDAPFRMLGSCRQCLGAVKCEHICCCKRSVWHVGHVRWLLDSEEGPFKVWHASLFLCDVSYACSLVGVLRLLVFVECRAGTSCSCLFRSTVSMVPFQGLV
jgi:hypothetical protein